MVQLPEHSLTTTYSLAIRHRSCAGKWFLNKACLSCLPRVTNLVGLIVDALRKAVFLYKRDSIMRSNDQWSSRDLGICWKDDCEQKTCWYEYIYEKHVESWKEYSKGLFMNYLRIC